MTPSFKLLIPAALASGFAALAFLPATAEASTTSKLLACHGPNKVKVTNCCEEIIRNHDDPLWFQQSGGTCSAVIKCTTTVTPVGITYGGGKKVTICRVVTTNENGGGDYKKPKGRPQQSRDPNGSLTHG